MPSFSPVFPCSVSYYHKHFECLSLLSSLSNLTCLLAICDAADSGIILSRLGQLFGSSPLFFLFSLNPQSCFIHMLLLVQTTFSRPHFLFLSLQMKFRPVSVIWSTSSTSSLFWYSYTCNLFKIQLVQFFSSLTASFPCQSKAHCLWIQRSASCVSAS